MPYEEHRFLVLEGIWRRYKYPTWPLRNLGDLLSLLLIIALTLLAYANSFTNQFVFDDLSLIVKNRYIHNMDRLFEKSPGNFLYSRPLANISLALDYKIWGSDPFGYHITNLLLHLANSILLYLIVVRLWGKNSLALFSGLLFSLHPVNTEAVAMIALGRGYLLSAFFSLLSWLFYLKWRSDNNKWSGIYIIGFVSCWFLAIAGNEIGFVLPMFLLIAGLQSNKRGRIWFFVIAASIPLLILLILPSIKAVLDPLLNSQGISRLSIIPYLMARYIKLLILPFGLSAWYEGMPLPQRLDLEMVLSFGVVGLLFGSIPILNKLDKRFALSLGLIIYILFIVSFRAINNPPSLMGERWVYLGSIGFCLFLALIIEKIWRIERIRGSQIMKMGVTAIFSGIIITYTLSAYIRNQDWKDVYTLWSSTVKKAPYSARAHYNLGLAAHIRGYIDQAEEEYNKTISIDPLFKATYNNLGMLYLNRGDLEDALREFERAIEMNPKDSMAHNNLGIVYAMKELPGLAEDKFKKAIMLDPENFKAHYNLELLYKKKGLSDKTISELKRGDPD